MTKFQNFNKNSDQIFLHIFAAFSNSRKINKFYHIIASTYFKMDNSPFDLELTLSRLEFLKVKKLILVRISDESTTESKSI